MLTHFFPEDAATLKGYANEAAESRIYAGIHYRFDVEAGKQQGISVGNFSVDAARADGGE